MKTQNGSTLVAIFPTKVNKNRRAKRMQMIIRYLEKRYQNFRRLNF